MHFSARNRNGNVAGVRQVRAGSKEIAIVAPTVAGDDGIQFYRSANDVILPDGIDGVIPPRLIRAIRLLPPNVQLWKNEDRQWKVAAPITNRNPL